MNLTHIRALKDQMELNILRAVSRETYEFYRRTGLTPESITVRMAAKSEIGHRDAANFATDIVADVRI